MCAAWSCTEGSEIVPKFCDFVPPDPAFHDLMLWGSIGMFCVFMCCPCFSIETGLVDPATSGADLEAGPVDESLAPLVGSD